jgi:hypothetical protein
MNLPIYQSACKEKHFYEKKSREKRIKLKLNNEKMTIFVFISRRQNKPKLKFKKEYF